jgi:hypothetical protein
MIRDVYWGSQIRIFSIPDPGIAATLVGLIIILLFKAWMFVRAYMEDFSDCFM